MNSPVGSLSSLFTSLVDCSHNARLCYSQGSISDTLHLLQDAKITVERLERLLNDSEREQRSSSHDEQRQVGFSQMQTGCQERLGRRGGGGGREWPNGSIIPHPIQTTHLSSYKRASSSFKSPRSPGPLSSSQVKGNTTITAPPSGPLSRPESRSGSESACSLPTPRKVYQYPPEDLSEHPHEQRAEGIGAHHQLLSTATSVNGAIHSINVISNGRPYLHESADEYQQHSAPPPGTPHVSISSDYVGQLTPSIIGAPSSGPTQSTFHQGRTSLSQGQSYHSSHQSPTTVEHPLPHHHQYYHENSQYHNPTSSQYPNGFHGSTASLYNSNHRHASEPHGHHYRPHSPPSPTQYYSDQHHHNYQKSPYRSQRPRYQHHIQHPPSSHDHSSHYDHNRHSIEGHRLESSEHHSDHHQGQPSSQHHHMTRPSPQADPRAILPPFLNTDPQVQDYKDREIRTFASSGDLSSTSIVATLTNDTAAVTSTTISGRASLRESNISASSTSSKTTLGAATTTFIGSTISTSTRINTGSSNVGSSGKREITATGGMATSTQRTDNTGSRTQFHAPLEPEVVTKLDDIFFKFLQRICSDLNACDSKGDHIHQPLMAKKMERLEMSTDFRPFKFRIQAFTNAFHDDLIANGLTEDILPLRKVKVYLWKHRYISRFNEDGKKQKSKGNHVWNIEARKISNLSSNDNNDGNSDNNNHINNNHDNNTGPESIAAAGGGMGVVRKQTSPVRWEFREYSSRIAGQVIKFARVGVPYVYSPRIWDAQMSCPAAKFSSPWLPPWLKWHKGELKGTPGPEDESCTITVIAEYVREGEECRLEMSFPLTVSDPSKEGEIMESQYEHEDEDELLEEEESDRQRNRSTDHHMDVDSKTRAQIQVQPQYHPSQHQQQQQSRHQSPPSRFQAHQTQHQLQHLHLQEQPMQQQQQQPQSQQYHHYQHDQHYSQQQQQQSAQPHRGNGQSCEDDQLSSDGPQEIDEENSMDDTGVEKDKPHVRKQAHDRSSIVQMQETKRRRHEP